MKTWAGRALGYYAHEIAQRPRSRRAYDGFQELKVVQKKADLKGAR